MRRRVSRRTLWRPTIFWQTIPFDPVATCIFAISLDLWLFVWPRRMIPTLRQWSAMFWMFFSRTSISITTEGVSRSYMCN
jgi:hypothetical protein